MLSRSIGGQNEESNYVILSANYHTAFHNWLGGTAVPSKPEDYLMFKRREIAGLRPVRKQTDILAEDWGLT